MLNEQKVFTQLNQLTNFVLINTSHPGNIGASARAIKTMGFKNLLLVNPQDFPNKVASYRAKSAIDVVNDAGVYKTIDEAINDAQFIVGTSARNRKLPWPLMEPRSACKEIISRLLLQSQRVAILFGREDRGLTNEELGRCNLHIHIPASIDYESLNLAQAVQIISYELRCAALNQIGTTMDQKWDIPLATDKETERLIQHMDEVMLEIDFYDPDNPRKILERIRRLFKRMNIDTMEVNILRGFFAAILNKKK